MSGKLPLSKYEIGSEQHSVQMSNTSEPKPEIKLSGVKLSQAIENYLKEWRILRKPSKKTLDKTLCAMEVLKELLGDVDVSTIKRRNMVEVLGQIQMLPSRFRTSTKKYGNKTAPQILKLKHDWKCMSDSTIKNNYLYWYNKLFHYLWINEIIFHNPAQDLDFKVEKNPDDDVLPYAKSDLLRLFRCPLYNRAADPEVFERLRLKGAHMYWFNLISLFTSIRLGSMSSLQTSDFIKHEETAIHFIKVNKLSDDKKVKSVNGFRLIPISPILIKLGILKYVKNIEKKYGESRIFPYLTKTETTSYGHGYSSDFRELIRKPYLDPFFEKGEKKNFHSFRHTIISELYDCDVDVFRITDISGHAPPSRSAVFNYIKPKNLNERYENIKKVNFGIDFEKEVPNYDEWIKD
jgi:integrase